LHPHLYFLFAAVLWAYSQYCLENPLLPSQRWIGYNSWNQLCSVVWRKFLLTRQCRVIFSSITCSPIPALRWNFATGDHCELPGEDLGADITLDCSLIVLVVYS
jgi:hypothetical protein